MDRVYELPLSPDYVRHWGLREAVRELIQNAIDSAADFEFALLPDGLILRSRGVRLDPSTLVLGATSKADDDSKIGSFGEGYKIALLVLTRLEKIVAVHNGPVVWQPEFRQSRAFFARTLHIVERPGPGTDDLEFRIFGLGQDELDEVVDSCLHMQAPIDDDIRVPQGRILPSRPGKLYVGGLYVCDTELEHGYDVKPQFIQLERDRQTVSNWDLRTLTRDMWMASGQHDHVAELIARECPDVDYVQYGGSTEEVREACYRAFQRMHPGAVAARTQAELDAMVERGMTKVVVVGGALYSTVTASKSYRENEGVRVAEPSPHAVLLAFFEHYGKHMPRLPKVAMKKLIERSRDWKLK